MTNTEIHASGITSRSTESYIEFLSHHMGASREEILSVTKMSGISARRIAEFLITKGVCLNQELTDFNKS